MISLYLRASVVCFIAGLLPVYLSAQEVVRLPSVEPPNDSPPGLLVSHPDSSAEILQTPGETDAELPPGVRNGVFQKVLFDSTWLAAGKGDGFGINDLRLQTIFALPCPRRDTPLVITPGFAVHYLEGPRGVDLPPRLYDATMQFRWLSQATPTLGLDLAITPGVFSDFGQQSSEAFRLTGHAAVAWTWTETAKIVLGAAYLDRPDAGVIPIGGLIWTPRDDLKFDLLFPTPRVAQRIDGGLSPTDAVQDWVYMAGEFAGDAWAMRHDDGLNDLVVLSDYRFILGVERKTLGGLSARIEAGYVFRRRIRFSDPAAENWPADTVMLRGGLTY